MRDLQKDMTFAVISCTDRMISVFISSSSCFCPLLPTPSSCLIILSERQYLGSSANICRWIRATWPLYSRAAASDWKYSFSMSPERENVWLVNVRLETKDRIGQYQERKDDWLIILFIRQKHGLFNISWQRKEDWVIMSPEIEASSSSMSWVRKDVWSAQDLKIAKINYHKFNTKYDCLKWVNMQK